MSRSRAIMLGILCSFLYQNALVKAADVALFNLTDFPIVTNVSTNILSEGSLGKKKAGKGKEHYITLGARIGCLLGLESDFQILFSKAVLNGKKQKLSFEGNTIDISPKSGNFLVLIYGFGDPGKYAKIKLDDNEENRKLLESVEQAHNILLKLKNLDTLLEKRAAKGKGEKSKSQVFRGLLKNDDSFKGLCKGLFVDQISLNNLRNQVFKKGRFQSNDLYGDGLRKLSALLRICKEEGFGVTKSTANELKQKLGIIPKAPPPPPPVAGFEAFKKGDPEEKRLKVEQLLKKREEARRRMAQEREEKKAREERAQFERKEIEARVRNVRDHLREKKQEEDEDDTWESSFIDNDEEEES